METERATNVWTGKLRFPNSCFRSNQSRAQWITFSPSTGRHPDQFSRWDGGVPGAPGVGKGQILPRGPRILRTEDEPRRQVHQSHSSDLRHLRKQPATSGLLTLLSGTTAKKCGTQLTCGRNALVVVAFDVVVPVAAACVQLFPRDYCGQSDELIVAARPCTHRQNV